MKFSLRREGSGWSVLMTGERPKAMFALYRIGILSGIVWTPIRNVSLYFRDWRGAASLGFRNHCSFVWSEGSPIRSWLSNQAQKLSRFDWTQLKTLVLLICRRETLKSMAGRILNCRKLLHEKLRLLGTPGSWNHLEDQKGMFGFTGLSGE